MTKYIKNDDGKFAGSIGQGRDIVPAPATVTTDIPAADTASTVSLGAVLESLPQTPAPALDADNPVVNALYGRSGAHDELTDFRARAQGYARVDKWELDGDDNMVWSNGYAAGIRYALRMLTAHDSDEAVAVIHAETQEDDDYRIQEAADAFSYNLDEGMSLDEALTREPDSYEYVLNMSQFEPEEQARILGQLTELSPKEQEALTVLLTENWTGTYSEAVAAARRLTA